MTRWRFARLVRHPVVATVIVIVLFPVVVKLSINAAYVTQLFAAADPATIADLRLKHDFDRDAAERQIRAALSAGDVDLASSFVELSGECQLSINPALVAEVNAVRATEDSVGSTISRFVRGFWTGQADDKATLAGTALSDLLYFGDVRDSARETAHYFTGQPYDPWILGMSTAGVVATTATYFGGVGVPERAGLSLAKIARRSARLNPVMAIRIFEAAKNGRLIELTENTARVGERAGVQGALDSLATAEGPEDMARIETLSAVKGSRTRAILKLFGRGAFVVGVTAWGLAKALTFAVLAGLGLLFWMLTAAFGFVGWCKVVARRLVRFLAPSRPRASSA